MMKIWITIGHPAQLNFYKNAIKELSKDNYVVITVIDRGKLLKISEKELGNIENCKLITIGKHSGNKISAIVDANIIRLLKLYFFYFKYKPKIALGNGYLHGVIGKTFNFPTIMFSDDIERRAAYFLMNTFSTEIYYVTGSDKMKKTKKISIFNSLKEWAYLSPKYFHPNKEVLLKYNIKENEYIFVREVITGTLNYQSQDSNLISSISEEFPKEMKVLFSLEDKSKLSLYPKDWILLQEPIDDIHSLIFFSKLLVSSGDSMAREGAMLGIPSIYCGVREMKANSVMISKGMLFHKKIDEVPNFISNLLKNNQLEDRGEFRNKLNDDWIDVTEFIVNRVNSFKNKFNSDDNKS